MVSFFLFKIASLSFTQEIEQIEIEPTCEIIIVEEEPVIEEKPTLETLVSDASNKYSVPKEVIYAIIATESNTHGTREINKENIFDVDNFAKSSCDCIGLMQISKYALEDYNKKNETNYNLEDLYDEALNIEIGVWYFSQFNQVASTWIEQYVIYNVGYGEFNKVNENSFYGWDGNLYSEYRNRFFYLNDMFPPTECEYSLYGENKLRTYGAKKRFEICLKVCNEIS